jgi:hypothetical protein
MALFKVHTFRQYQKSGNAGIAYKNSTGKVNRIGMLVGVPAEIGS